MDIMNKLKCKYQRDIMLDIVRVWERNMNNVLRIGICDDEKVIYSEMNKYITFYSEQRKIAVKTKYYKSGIELLENEKIIDLDILFLDIDMPELDGIETAYQLNKFMKNCKIVMLTSKTERFKEAFKIGAFRFVTKPIEQQEVFDAIDDVRERMIGNKELTLFRDGKNYIIQQKDILYVMMDKTSAYIFTEKHDFRSGDPLSWWEQELDERIFVRCHKSYIVNLSKIVDIEKRMIRLVGGEMIPVAKRRKEELELRFMKYDTKYR